MQRPQCTQLLKVRPFQELNSSGDLQRLVTTVPNVFLAQQKAQFTHFIGGFRGGDPKGSRPPFSLEFCIIFLKIILRKINITYIHVAGNCSDPPSLFGCMPLHLVSVLSGFTFVRVDLHLKVPKGKRHFSPAYLRAY